MYSGSGFSDWEIGDITVIIHQGVYHLFHLIIPNHDYIAHAVSADGLSWKRVNNALFVGHPGEWDDDMLWTMHVCEVGNKFEMYYTGLQRKDRGVISRIGLAESEDLIKWTKNQKNIFPIEPKGIFYETATANPRTWLSFRDPFRFEHRGEVYLLLDARTINGPVSRRGCVGLIKITHDMVELLPPLLYPLVYDDIECPCVFELHGRFYLLGSIREDIKVRYWFAPDFLGEYHSFHNDVILPQGNYAARIVQDGPHILVYNFFFTYGKIDSLRVLPPPKQLDTDPDGRLVLKSFYRWETMVRQTFTQKEFGKPTHLFSNPTASSVTEPDKITCGARNGYELFCFQKPSSSFIWEGVLTVEGMGKLGLVSDIDMDGNGYFISFNATGGEVKIRAWGFNPLNTRQNFIFNDIQSGFFEPNERNTIHFRLIRYGHYIELSIDDIVKLTLMDYTYSGNGFGLYSASSVISLQQSVVKALPDPEEEYAGQEEAQKIE
ncbi:glycosyl hydrolase family 32 [Runella slithyformis]|uniref:Glycosyl hydrolase family 32 domain protein n=1 Tax=Runella slithyformis (strain ATCC 29530 / DSM 19594 / LMG 11500 / NCIMB 11436 / LSU 4) TaxID=761193 RepID=A0A7U3ZP25_RUNSL|nr:glycosyl hydrolase family 32 [Runella slithyformis]AEI50747.1 Glycosyl hydrolase family 32 domain protein [Runella slithyformis DSM 19594]